MGMSKKNSAGIAGVIKEKERKKDEDQELAGSGLYGEWLIEDETRSGKKKPRRAKRSMKDLRKSKHGAKKNITHSRMTSSKKKGDKMDQWTKYYN
jgi:hypothetical protein